jgi:hypothetical protein
MALQTYNLPHDADGRPRDVVVHEKPLHHPIDRGFEARLRRLPGSKRKVSEEDKACDHSR